MSTLPMIKLGSVLLVVASLAAAFVGWVALSAVWASAAMTPGVGEATTSARRLLSSADEALAEVRTTLEVVGSVTDAVATEAEAAATALDEAADITSERIPAALGAVEESLPALIDTAAVVEDTMQALSVIGIRYDPAVPFDQALINLQAELDGLPEVVAEQGANLEALVPEIRRTGEDTGAISGHLAAIDSSLGDAQVALSEFGDTVSELERSTELGARLVPVIPVARIAVLLLAAAGAALGVVAWTVADRLAEATAPVVTADL
jgi:hypothetical protein